MKSLSRFVHPLIAVSTLLLAGFASSNSLSAEEKRTESKAAQPSEKQSLSNFNQPYSVSQIVSFAYNCVISVEQPSTTPPIANYRSSLTCSVGRPAGFVLALHRSNVNFPTDLRYIGPNSHSCTLTASSCAAPMYTRSIDRTQNLWVYAGVNILGSDGVIYTVPNAGQAVRTYNEKGAAYPLIRPTRTDMSIVPFPVDPPYVERVPRASNFADELRRIYTTRNWVIPPDAQAHHIKPLAWGGGNDPSTNGVFLGPATHLLFTTWWASFSNLNW